MSAIRLRPLLFSFLVISIFYHGRVSSFSRRYMVRLSIWGPGSPFRDFNDFLADVQKRDVGAKGICNGHENERHLQQVNRDQVSL